MLDNYDFIRRFIAETPAEIIRPPRLVSGEDLIAMGLKPGPHFKELLQSIEDAQLNEAIHTREEAVDLLRSLLSRTSIK
jgi:poly(A) polymerase